MLRYASIGNGQRNNAERYLSRNINQSLSNMKLDCQLSSPSFHFPTFPFVISSCLTIMHSVVYCHSLSTFVDLPKSKTGIICVLIDSLFSVLCFVDHCLSFLPWPLCCLSFDLRIRIHPFGNFKHFSIVSIEII